MLIRLIASPSAFSPSATTASADATTAIGATVTADATATSAGRPFSSNPITTYKFSKSARIGVS